jgi:putative membrane protein
MTMRDDSRRMAEDVKQRIARTAVVTAFCLLLSALSCAATASEEPVKAAATDGSAAVKPAPADGDFIFRTNAFNSTQITLGKLAEQRVQKGSTLSLAVKLIIGHTNIAVRLAELAAKEGVTLPAKPDPAHRALIERLQSVSDREFDADYIGAAIQEQTQAIALFEAEARREQASDYQQFVAAELPVLREFLKQAQEAQPKLSIPEGIKLSPKLERR